MTEELEHSETNESVLFMGIYRENVQKLLKLSLIQSRQLMGSLPATDPRMQFVSDLQGQLHLANAQILATMHVLQEILRVLKDDLQIKQTEIQLLELKNQIEVMEKDLCVTGWDPNGEPILNLQEYRKRTEGWPE